MGSRNVAEDYDQLFLQEGVEGNDSDENEMVALVLLDPDSDPEEDSGSSVDSDHGILWTSPSTDLETEEGTSVELGEEWRDVSDEEPTPLDDDGITMEEDEDSVSLTVKDSSVEISVDERDAPLAVDDINRFEEDSRESGTVLSDPLATDPLDEEGEGSDAESEPVDEMEVRQLMAEELGQGLEGSLDLFRNDPITASWTEKVEGLLSESMTNLESSPEEAKQSLAQLTRLVLQGDSIQTALLEEGKKELEGSGGKLLTKLRTGEGFTLAEGVGKYGLPMFRNDEEGTEKGRMEKENDPEEGAERDSLADYSPEERMNLFKGLRYRLDRQAFLLGIAADYFQTVQKGHLLPGREISNREIVDLKEKTEAVRNYFGVDQVGQRWRKNFEVDGLYEILTRLESETKEGTRFRPVSSSSEEDSFQSNQMILRDRINSICYKIRTTPMTAQQRKVLENPIVSSWIRSVAVHACDQTDPYTLLYLFERYERTGGGDTGRELGKMAYRMKTSRSESGTRLGDAVNMVYNNPNVKVYISQAFMNRFLPIRDPEFDVVQERILGNPVAGSRRTDTQVHIKLIPNSERLLMNLVVTGRIVASTQSEVFPAKVFNESYANYLGQKQIEWRDNGIVWSDCEVAVNNSSQLSGVQTNIDFVPIVGNLAREMVKGEYQSRQEAIRQETKERIEREVKRRIDSETTERFKNVNSRLNQNFFGYLDSLGLSLTLQNSKTTDDWLLASLRLAEPGSLGSQTAEPPTLTGAFADLKIHESAINTALARLDLSGKDFTPEELCGHLAEILKRPGLADQDFGEVDLYLGMAEKDPISVSFEENLIRLHLRFSFIELGNQGWDDIEVTVAYEPVQDENGNLVLARRGLVSVNGPLNIRAQIPLRTIFSKVFTAEGRVPLKPALFDKDERFAGLSTGLCRITNGWFAISVIDSEAIGHNNYPRLSALREKIANRPRLIQSENSLILGRPPVLSVPTLR